MDVSTINWLAVIAAGIAAWALGALWYSPVLFGKSWQQETGLTEESLKNTSMAKVFGTSAVLMILMALGLAMFFQGDAEMNWKTGMQAGLITGLLFIAPSIGINYL
ncbi:MAG: DUF1761 domain-containing protein [Saprospiraceae bacterium]|nr:DUF1761 domain-containing protein [Saprospiraceae bacterium]